MDPDAELHRGFRLGEWEVRPAEGLLIGLQGRRRLQPKCIDVLMCLVEHEDQVVTRDEILRAVWGERAFTDEPLTRCIGDLRKALGDSREKPRYVQTIPKRGYRLIAKVIPLSPSESEPVPVPEAAPAPEAKPTKFSALVTYRLPAAVLAGLAAVFTAIGLLSPTTNQNGQPTLTTNDHSIAVLPFEAMTSGTNNDWMGRGISEDLLNVLARIDGLEVAARTSSFRPSLQSMDIRDIGKELGVRYVLEGSIRRSDDRLKIAAQLIDTSTGFNLWSEVYNRRTADVFAIQTEIAERVVKALKLTTPIGLTSEAFARTTSSVDAYDYYLQARSFLDGPTTVEAITNAIRFYERALEFDPEYGEAYAGLCSVRLKAIGDNQAPDTMPEVRKACDAATKYAPDSPLTRTALGKLRRISGELQRAEDVFLQVIEQYPAYTEARVEQALVYAERGNLEAAERAYREAIEVGPGDPLGYSHYCLFLWTNGRAAEAIPVCQRVTELQPGSAQAYSNLGIAYGVSGDFKQAAVAYREAVARKPSSLAYSNIGINYYYLGRYEDAAVMFREAIKLAPRNFTFWGNLGDALLQLPGQESETSAAYREARKLAELDLEINPDQDFTLAALAHFCARLWDFACARDRLEVSLAAESTEFYKYYYAALAYIQMDEYENAVAETMRAVKFGFPLEMLEAEPLLASVRSNERLALLIEEETNARR